MNIVYFHQYFTTPDRVGGIRSYEMARRLVAKGHTVHLLTSSNETRDEPGWFERDIEGIRVHSLPIPYSNRQSNTERIRTFFSFAFGAANRARSLGADVVFATSTPLTIAIPGILASRLKRVPLVFEVRDLWPEAPVAMGALTSPLAIYGAGLLERIAYRSSAHVVALSPGMKEGVLKQGVRAENVSVIPNASDLELFRPELDGQGFRDQLGLGDKTVLLYFGTMGEANGLSFVLDGAAELKRRGRDDIAIVLHGDGRERDVLEARKNRDNLDNVIFSTWNLHREDLARLVASADVCMTIYKNVPVLYTCSPNKMFDSLSAGKPVLTNMPGWLGGMIEQNEAGVFVQPDNVTDFADKAEYLAAHPERLKTYGQNARKLAEREFSRDLLADKLEAVLQKVVAKKRSPVASERATV